MKEIHDRCKLHSERSSSKIREELHASQMRKLLSQIPWYALQARQRLDAEGRDGELRYWLALYSEFHHQTGHPHSEIQPDEFIRSSPLIWTRSTIHD